MAEQDHRDARTWVAVELSAKGEGKVEDGTIVRTIVKDMGLDEAHEIFVPAITYVKGNRTITVHLIEGYIFIASGLPEVDYFRLENQTYVNQVMSSHEGEHHLRALSVIPDASIAKLKLKLRDLVVQDISIGSWVRVVDGRFHNLCGKVMGTDDDHINLCIYMRSLDVITSVPTAFLELTSKPDFPERKGVEGIRRDLPSKDLFTDPVVSVLGMFSEYTPELCFEHEPLVAAVLSQMGVDIQALPYGWNLEGENGLFPLLEEAFEDVCNAPNAYMVQGRSKIWGLTEAGAKKAQVLNCVPTAMYFYKHVLVVLGQMSMWKAFHYIPLEEAIPQILWSAGINPRKPQRGWTRGGRGGLDRKISFAFRNQKDVYSTLPRTIQGPIRGHWGLTPEGIIQARGLLKAGTVLSLIPRLA